MYLEHDLPQVVNNEVLIEQSQLLFQKNSRLVRLCTPYIIFSARAASYFCYISRSIDSDSHSEEDISKSMEFKEHLKP